MMRKINFKNIDFHKIYGIIDLYLASMAELVDAADSKSASSDRVPVQVRMEAP